MFTEKTDAAFRKMAVRLKSTSEDSAKLFLKSQRTELINLRYFIGNDDVGGSLKLRYGDKGTMRTRSLGRILTIEHLLILLNGNT